MTEIRADQSQDNSASLRGSVCGGVPLFGIYSYGRSGSTWLGAIFDSHPEIAYRFEPFHRLSEARGIRETLKAIESGTFSAPGCRELYDSLVRADPVIAKPPFFKKSNARLLARSIALRQVLWYSTKRLKPLRWIYRSLYTPTGQPVVVFKEVTMAERMGKIVDAVDMKMIYLVRHPCGCVASVIKGQSSGLMPSDRFRFLESLLEKHDPELAGRYRGKFKELSPHQLNALLWRIDIEQGIETVRSGESVKAVLYEDLCDRPGECSEALLAHFGMDYHPQTQRFIEESTTENISARWSRGERFINSYFSVFRNPKEGRDRWKKQLSKAEQKEIMEMVLDSEAYQYCLAMGVWKG